MSSISKEDRILREWTPIILRTLLAVSAVVLLAGLLAMAFSKPGYYVERFRVAQYGRGSIREEWTQLGPAALKGDPHSIMTIGLLLLTLVPLARVTFTFFLFLGEGDHTFAALTAYVW